MGIITYNLKELLIPSAEVMLENPIQNSKYAFNLLRHTLLPEAVIRDTFSVTMLKSAVLYLLTFHTHSLLEYRPDSRCLKPGNC
jgi:hypothetical protein